MPGVFLSYRRQDSGPTVGRLYDRLAAHFGADRVFRDIDTLAPGAEFAQVIRERIHGCDAAVVVIGSQWLSLTDAEGRRRLDDPHDLLKAEIAEALTQRKLVIPALLDGARMPSRAELPSEIVMLADRNAIEISDRRFGYDVDQLIRALEGKDMSKSLWGWFSNPTNQGTLRVIGGAFAAVVVAAWSAYVYLNPTPETHPAPKVADHPAIPTPSVHVKQKNIEGSGNEAAGITQDAKQEPLQAPQTVIVEQQGVRGDGNKAIGINTGTISAGKDTGQGSAKEKK